MQQKDVTILTEYMDGEDLDEFRINQRSFWKAWVKEYPGIWETGITREDAISRLRVSIPFMWDTVTGKKS